MSAPRAPRSIDLWRRNGLIWLALMGLVLLTLGIAYSPFSSIKTAGGLWVAITKTLLIAVVFMELRRARPLIRVVAIAGLLFLLALFGLSLTDVVARM